MCESRHGSKPTLLPCLQYLGYFVYSKLRYPPSAAAQMDAGAKKPSPPKSQGDSGSAAPQPCWDFLCTARVTFAAC